MKKIESVKFDHIAIRSSDIEHSISWYSKLFEIEVLYQDETWAVTKIGGTKLAFIKGDKHPPHICFNVDESKFEFDESKFKIHRDGSRSEYIKDPDNNFIELLKWQ